MREAPATCWGEGNFIGNNYGKRSFCADRAEVTGEYRQATDKRTMMVKSEYLAAGGGWEALFHGTADGTMAVNERITAGFENDLGSRRFQMGEGGSQANGSGRERRRTLNNDEDPMWVDCGIGGIWSHCQRSSEQAKRQKCATPRQNCGNGGDGWRQGLRTNASFIVGTRAARERSRNNPRAMRRLESTKGLRLIFDDDGVTEIAAGCEGDSNDCCRRSITRTTHRECPPSEFGILHCVGNDDEWSR